MLETKKTLYFPNKRGILCTNLLQVNSETGTPELQKRAVASSNLFYNALFKTELARCNVV